MFYKALGAIVGGCIAGPIGVLAGIGGGSLLEGEGSPSVDVKSVIVPPGRIRWFLSEGYTGNLNCLVKANKSIDFKILDMDNYKKFRNDKGYKCIFKADISYLNSSIPIDNYGVCILMGNKGKEDVIVEYSFQ